MNYKKIIKTFLLVTIFCMLFTQCSFANQQDFKTNMILAQRSSSIRDKIDYYNKATEAALNGREPNYNNAAMSAFNVGLIAGKAHYIQDSIIGYSSCIAILKKSNKLDNSEIGFSSLYNLAQIYIGIGRKTDAKDTCELLVATQETYPPKYHYEMLKMYYQLGCMNLQEGSLNKAEVYFDKVVYNASGADNKDGADIKTHTLLKLGEINQKLNNTTKALKCYNEALLRSQSGYPDIINIAHAYSNVGMIYDNQGEVEKAQTNYEKAIEYYKKAELNTFYLKPNQIGSQILIIPQKEETYKRLIALDEKQHENVEKINLLKKECSQYIPIKVVK